MEALRECQECGKPVKGRTDKKFCDDYCRNSYNNRHNSDYTNHMRNVNNILRKNRRLLELAIPAGEGLVKCMKRKIADQGFNFTYHTHQYTNKKGDVYFFCYEYGYLPLEGDWLLIVRRKDEQQAN
ncbi:MAG: hypothetical protein EOO04_29620 [Chitinophagaceae bacterium]|nr:MAG: hypothetical protein EOO04_29620 [Chitinophagaceae bacterium]